MGRVILIERKNCEELMDFLGLVETLDRQARTSDVRWYGHTLRRDNDDVFRRALDFEVIRRGRGDQK